MVWCNVQQRQFNGYRPAQGWALQHWKCCSSLQCQTVGLTRAPSMTGCSTITRSLWMYSTTSASSLFRSGGAGALLAGLCQLNLVMWREASCIFSSSLNTIWSKRKRGKPHDTVCLHVSPVKAGARAINAHFRISPNTLYWNQVTLSEATPTAALHLPTSFNSLLTKQCIRHQSLQTLHLLPTYVRTFCSFSPFWAAPSTLKDLTLHQREWWGHVPDTLFTSERTHQTDNKHVHCIYCGSFPANWSRHIQTLRKNAADKELKREVGY